MQKFHAGDRKEGLRLQEEFAAEFRKEYAELSRDGGTSYFTGEDDEVKNSEKIVYF